MDDTEKRRQSAELNARDLAPVLTRGGPAPASSFSLFYFHCNGSAAEKYLHPLWPLICIFLYNLLVGFFFFFRCETLPYRNAHLFFFFF